MKKKKKKPPSECVLIEPDPHVSVRHAFISSVSSPGFTSRRKVCTLCTSDFTAWDSYPALLYQRGGVAVAVLWNFWGGVVLEKGVSGGPAALIIAWVCLGGTCLPVLRKIISESRNKERENVALLHEPTPPFSVLFISFSASCSFCPHSSVCLSLSLSKFRARAWVDLRGLKKQDARPHRTAYVWVFFCVCSRDLQELNPPEKEKAALQYASWGPQGNQLVRLPLPHLPNRCVVFVICPSI